MERGSVMCQSVLAHEGAATGLGSGQDMDSVVWKLGSLTKDESRKWFVAACSDDDEEVLQQGEICPSQPCQDSLSLSIHLRSYISWGLHYNLAALSPVIRKS
ncbi:hypothetical protein Mapa_003289 [Marchantia paleacea]|nr:hypothetical protein Mapa_003289 [Marchantia paleacea]